MATNGLSAANIQNVISQSFHRNTFARMTQMDESDGRLKFHPDDAASQGSSLTEHINLEEPHYTALRDELDFDAKNLEADSWSLTVDASILKALTKGAIVRQDVIYELILTEMNLVRTLKIIFHVYMHELHQTLHMDKTKLERLFPAVEDLLAVHQTFLTSLKNLQSLSQEEGSCNYDITLLGDILISQFSGMLGEKMMQSYSIFCGCQSEAIAFYKEQMQSNKRLQIVIKKIDQLPLVRRLGIPECFLLVAQRITKYPVLLERIIQNTEVDTAEYKNLEKALALLKETITQVDVNVREYKKQTRLRDIGYRLEPRPLGRMKDGHLFRREDLIQGNKTLLHEGTLSWKCSGKQKDVLAVLLSDALLLLQEKDQKLVFASMENKPPLISLQGLIVREVAKEERAMYLICVSSNIMPEMYELHTSSKDECLEWISLIRQSVDTQQYEKEYNEQIVRLQQFQDNLQMMDEQINKCLTQKLKVYAALYENATARKAPVSGLFFRSDLGDLQQGEVLLNGAIIEAENLQNLLFMQLKDKLLPKQEDEDVVHRSEKSDDAPLCNSQTSEEHFERDQDQLDFEDFEVDASPLLERNFSTVPGSAMYDSVIMLAQRLYSLQALIVQQDSRMELQQTFHSKIKHMRNHSNVLLEQERQRNLERQKEDLANLHKMQAQHQEEQQRWEKTRERHARQMEALEADLQLREEECQRREEALKKDNSELLIQKEDYQRDLERLRETTQTLEKEKKQLSALQERLEKRQLTQNSSYHHYVDPTKSSALSSYSSFRVGNGGTPRTNEKSHPATSDSLEVPPRVPQRRESISPKSMKQELPVHLISTTNQVQKAAVVQQRIPSKLASKGKGKSFKEKRTHQRTNSAASIEVTEVVPIRGTGGSLRVYNSNSPSRKLTQDTFKPPGSANNIKPSQSFSTNRRSGEEPLPSPPPPPPPPFPKEILTSTPTLTKEAPKEKVLFF